MSMMLAWFICGEPFSVFFFLFSLLSKNYSLTFFVASISALVLILLIFIFFLAIF
jgi:hypothetical protein